MYRNLILSSLAAFAAFACSSPGGDGDLDKWGKPTLGSTGYQDDADAKADGLSGLKGPSVSFDNNAAQVWPVENQWNDTDTPAAREAGLAWGENSGLTWDEKYSAWVDSMERTGSTFVLTTPYGKSLDAPDLECAETAMFLRITFASWYHLPFFMEARDGSTRVYFGHMGIVTDSGNRWGQMPNFKTRYQDYSYMADQVRENPDLWPSDAALRDRKIGGSSSDYQTALDAEHAGAYFDEIFLNKRVGYFLTIQLAFMGSVSLADSANTFNMSPFGFATGDFIVERMDTDGIGHTIILKEVFEYEEEVSVDGKTTKIKEVEVMSGSMPRRQPLWEDASSGRYYLLDEYFGGEETVEYGAGLKRFRAAVSVDGKWTNVVLPQYASLWINSNHHDDLVERQEHLALIVPQADPQRRINSFVAKAEREREWLREHPSSCSARIRREDAFREIREAGQSIGFTAEQMDAKYRTLEDYVFAELVYDESKTCCWNSSTATMYEVVMKYNRCLLGDVTDTECDAITDFEVGTCQPPVPFMNRDDSGDGYKMFADFAAANGYSWVAWSADENCPQASVAEDTLAESESPEYCELAAIDTEVHCAAGEVACEGSGECIPESYICDNYDDCSNGADEVDCTARPCDEETEFSCDNGQCVSAEWICDGDNDCGDHSDEQGCEE